MTCSRAIAGSVLVAAVVLVVTAGGEESLTAARQRLEQLSAAEKQELDEKRKWFYSLPPADQQRLRDLHQQLCQAPDAEQLRQTMRRYSDWLRTLSTGERAELLSMPAESRLAQIKALLKQQGESRLRHYARELSDADLAVVLRWMEEFAKDHEAEILDRWPHTPGHLDKIDPDRRPQMLVFMALAPVPGREPLRPSEEEVQRLKARLSPTAQQELTKAQREGQLVELAERWMRAAIFSRRATPPPPVAKEELQRFYTGLDARQREYFERLPSERMEAELTRAYHYAQRSRSFEGDRPGFPWWGGEGFRGRRSSGDGPRGDRRPGEWNPGERARGGTEPWPGSRSPGAPPRPAPPDEPERTLGEPGPPS